MAEGIIRGGSGGIDVSDANAKPSQVVKGYTFYSDRSEDPQTGTMPDMSGTSIVITPDETGTIPAGYHDGTGVVKVDLSAQTAGAEDILEGTDIFIDNGEGSYVLVQGEIPERTVDDIEINWSDSEVTATVWGGYYPDTTKQVADAIWNYTCYAAEADRIWDWDGKYAEDDIVLGAYYTSTTPSRTATDVTLFTNSDSQLIHAYFPYGYYGTKIDKTLLNYYSDNSDDDNSDGMIIIEPTTNTQKLTVAGTIMRDNIYVPWDGPKQVATGRCTLISGENQRATLTYSDINFIPDILMICSKNNSDSYEIDDMKYISYLFYSAPHNLAQVAGCRSSSEGDSDQLTELELSSDHINVTLNDQSALVVGFNDGNAFWRPYNAYYAVAMQL